VFDPNSESVHLVKVAGQVIHVRGQTYFLTDGTNGLRFTVRGSTGLALGERAQVVGVPQNDGRLPALRQASVQRAGKVPLPTPHRLTAGDLVGNLYDSTLVQLDAKVLNVRTNPVEQVLELMAGPRVFLARLDSKLGQFPNVLPDSRVRITGVFTSQSATGSGAARANTSTAELLMNSPADLVILERPSWWNLRHALLVLGVMGFALAGAFTWITALRRRVERRTRELREEIAGHQRTETQLHEKTGLLQAQIEERNRMQIEVEHIHRELVDASRQAGQAEVAASVLHNVGNVLNSVNVSTNLVTEQVRRLPLDSFHKAVELMREHAADLDRFITTDEKGRRLPQFLEQLDRHLGREQETLLVELDTLGKNMEHIKEIIAMQQAYAKRFGVLENASLPDLIESALKLHTAAFERHSIKLRREFEAVPEMVVDKHKVLQILVNLFQNAKYACSENGLAERNVIVRVRQNSPGRVCVEVADNGMGIAPENMTRIFGHGFTTRKNGHGFGLHSSVLAAREMKGDLTVHSEGLGKGARFTLELPVQPEAESPDSESAPPPAAGPAS
jgi:signal transduction histidine kinase